MELKLDPNVLTVGDLADFEAASGESWNDVFAKGEQPSGKALTALVWVLGRRENPEFTLEAARNVKVTELDFGGVADANPPVEAVS